MKRRTAKVLGIGETYISEKGNFKVQRRAGGIEITDTRNAGIRGEQCASMTITYWRMDEKAQAAVIPDLTDIITEASDYWEAASAIQKYIDQGTGLSDGRIPGVEIHESILRAIDVEPTSMPKIVITTDKIRLECTSTTFYVQDLTDKYNEPTFIPRNSRNRKDTKAFYLWAKQNEALIKRMRFSEIREAVEEAGIRTHSYSAMD